MESAWSRILWLNFFWGIRMSVGPLTVLACDGGGVKGVVTARLLQEIEERTGMATSSLFRFMGGTSSGAINVVSLNIPDSNGKAAYSAKKVVELFQKKAKKIFPGSIIRSIWTVSGYLFSKYSNKGLIEVLGEYGGSTKFGDLLGDVAVLVVDSKSSKPTTLLSRSEEFSTLTTQEVLTAAAAAPSYLPAYPLEIDGKTTSFSDGGLAQNDPAQYDLDISQPKFPQCQGTPIVVSIGTGKMKSTGVSGFTAEHLGKLGWLPDILNIETTASDDVQNTGMEARLGDNFYRLQVPISNDSLDDSSEKNMSTLLAETEAWIRDNDSLLDQLCDKLMAARCREKEISLKQKYE